MSTLAKVVLFESLSLSVTFFGASVVIGILTTKGGKTSDFPHIILNTSCLSSSTGFISSMKEPFSNCFTLILPKMNGVSVVVVVVAVAVVVSGGIVKASGTHGVWFPLNWSRGSSSSIGNAVVVVGADVVVSKMCPLPTSLTKKIWILAPSESCFSVVVVIGASVVVVVGMNEASLTGNEPR